MYRRTNKVPRSGTINFVHDNDGLNALLKCLLQHEASLWFGSIDRVDDKENTVNHVHDALYLTSEI